MENINHTLQENIQSFVNDNLDAPGRQALLDQAQASPEVAGELAFSQSLTRVLHHREVVAAALVLQAVIAEEGFPPPPHTFGARKWWKWAGFGTLLLALFAGVFFWADNRGLFASESQQLSRSVAQPLENVLFLPKDGPGLADLQTGMAAYDGGRYAGAARSLETYLARRPDNAARVYLGVARLFSGQADRAVQPLADAAQSQEPPIQEAALWYLALAHLENDNPYAARQALASIPADGIYGEQARILLEKLK